MPEPGTTGNGGAIGGSEADVVHDDVKTLIGSNQSDTLTGSNTADTMLGAAPVGTGSGVVDSPAGNDTILGCGGDDSLVGGDRGQVGGGDGNDTLVGGRSTAAGSLRPSTEIPENDTIVSGLGNDEIFGDAGNNTLAYASVKQQGIDIVDRGSNGVMAQVPDTGQTANGGKIGGPGLTSSTPTSPRSSEATAGTTTAGNNLANTLLGVAPSARREVKPGPPGNDILSGIRRRRPPVRLRRQRLALRRRR